MAGSFSFPFFFPGGGSGSADVVGPGTSTDNALVRFDGATGKLLQNSLALLGDAGDLLLNASGLTTQTALSIVGLNALTTGRIADFVSGSASLGVRTLARVANQSATAINTTAFEIEQAANQIALDLSSNASIQFQEVGAAPASAINGKLRLWAKSETPNRPFFTSDTNVDWGWLLGRTDSSVVALGFTAATNSTVGCVAIGLSTLFGNTGLSNTAVGNSCLLANIGGSQNTGMGAFCMPAMISGTLNTCVGSFAMLVATGSENSGFGQGSLNKLTTGNNNSAGGRAGFDDLTTGSGNSGWGHHCGANLTTGSNCTFLGADTTVNSGARTGVIVIGITSAGVAAQATNDNGLFFHNNLSVVAGTDVQYVGATGQMGPIVSSRRVKKNIEDIETASHLIYQLRPVSFDWIPDHMPRARDFGYIAEEVAEVIPQAVPLDADGLPCSVSSKHLLVLAIAEIKKLSAHLTALQAQVDGLLP